MDKFDREEMAMDEFDGSENKFEGSGFDMEQMTAQHALADNEALALVRRELLVELEQMKLDILSRLQTRQEDIYREVQHGQKKILEELARLKAAVR